MCAQSLSLVGLFATIWTVACLSPLSMGFLRQEYWNVLPFPPPGDRPDPGIKPTSPASPALAGGFFTTEPPVHFSSVTQSCPTLCDPMNLSTPGLPVHHQLPEFSQTHFKWEKLCPVYIIFPQNYPLCKKDSSPLY